MKTKSLNTIVREALLDNNLPLHYYSRYLHHGLRIVDELSMDFDMGNIKMIELDVTSYQRAILPADFVDFIDVSAKHGERLLPMERERTLNKNYNYDEEGNKIPYNSSISINYDAEINYNLISGSNNMNTRGELVGRYYGRKRFPKLTFDIDTKNQEIVFSNGMILTKVTLVYITSAVSSSSANVITPYATDVVVNYINMMAAKAEGTTLGKYQLAKQEFENSRRKFRARMNAMDYAEIIGAIRNGIYGSVKN
jgi:hypothetical protein